MALCSQIQTHILHGTLFPDANTYSARHFVPRYKHIFCTALCSQIHSVYANLSDRRSNFTPM